MTNSCSFQEQKKKQFLAVVLEARVGVGVETFLQASNKF